MYGACKEELKGRQTSQIFLAKCKWRLFHFKIWILFKKYVGGGDLYPALRPFIIVTSQFFLIARVVWHISLTRHYSDVDEQTNRESNRTLDEIIATRLTERLTGSLNDTCLNHKTVNAYSQTRLRGWDTSWPAISSRLFFLLQSWGFWISFWSYSQWGFTCNSKTVDLISLTVIKSRHNARIRNTLSCFGRVPRFKSSCHSFPPGFDFGT